jgi:ATP-dependent DNA helicase RecG
MSRPDTFIHGGSEELVERLVEGLAERLAENQRMILGLIIRDPHISKKAMAQAAGISTTAIDKHLTKLKQRGILCRVGPDKGGHWEVVQEDEGHGRGK